MAVFDDIKTLLGKKKSPPPKQHEPKKKVLIVEDESVLLQMYKDKLTHEGFDVTTAENGEQGLHKATTNRPDIILLDLMMPVMGGIAMLRKLRAIPHYKNLPVIVLTNAGDVDNIKETQHFEHACEFLIKSNVTVDEIVKKVKFWM